MPESTAVYRAVGVKDGEVKEGRWGTRMEAEHDRHLMDDWGYGVAIECRVKRWAESGWVRPAATPEGGEDA